MKKVKLPQQTPSSGRWIAVIVIILLLGFVSFITAIVIGIFISNSEVEPSGNVAQIAITGAIVSNAPGGFMNSGFSDATQLIKLIEKADKNKNVKAILFEINSPGGSAVASWELQRAIKATNKTTVAWVREAGVSGSYWAASATDHIVASPVTIIGSIGVIASYIDFSGTLERYNASYQRLVSGDFKDIGSPLKPLEEEEEQILQGTLDNMRVFFADSVAENRNLPKEKVNELADGRFWLGMESIELGLVDELGGKKEAIRWIEKNLDIEADIAEYKKPKTLGEILAGVYSDSSFDVGRGIGKSLVDHKAQEGIVVNT